MPKMSVKEEIVALSVSIAVLGAILTLTTAGLIGGLHKKPAPTYRLLPETTLAQSN